MTKTEAIKLLKVLIFMLEEQYATEEIEQAIGMATEALSAEAETVDCTEFIRWLTETVMDDGMWELNAVAYGEVIARKLTKLGVLEVKDRYYIRHIENNTKESDLVYRSSSEAEDTQTEGRARYVAKETELAHIEAKIECAEKRLHELKTHITEWIPVSERLPDGQTEVIVSCIDNSGDTKFSYTSSGWVTTDKEYWIVDNEINPFVVAWMPLPKPYREDGEKE